MSILIKGLIMPSCCDGCTFSDWSNLHQTASCKLHDYDPCFEDYGMDYTEKRADFCPLVEIPVPHGRLIDGDALHCEVDDIGLGYFSVYGVTEDTIDSAPTVIEAEGSENDDRVDDWTCDGCKHRHVWSYAYPCSECHEGSKFEPEEGSENHAD